MPGLAHTLIDRVAAEFGQGEWQAEITAAREEHDRLAGKLFEDDGELYEQRMAAFVEWYVAERPLAKAGKPPALVMLEGAESEPGSRAGLSVEERGALAAVLASHRSVFEVTAVEERELVVCDLIGGARFVVRERRSTVGFDVGDLVEARLICVGGGDAGETSVAFGKTFMFHPRDAREGVLGIIAAALAAGEGRAEIVGRLARVCLRWRRQRVVGAERLYKEAIGK